jgi:succinate dehydrogenase / fumarate reductase membrane anchor subunit
MQDQTEKLKVAPNYETIAWKWMRYSGLLLIPLAWAHVALNDVIVGVHRIDINLVALRWATLGWRVYDMLLLAFAFAHGMNGLRQVLRDFIKDERQMRAVSWGLLLVWAALSAIGAASIIGGVRLE